MENIIGLDKGITRLVEYGALGIMLLVALAAIGILYRHIVAIQHGPCHELRQGRNRPSL